MSQKLRTYLSGPIEGAKDGGAGWRDAAKETAKKLTCVTILCPKTFNAQIDAENEGWRDKKSHTDEDYMRCIRRIIRRDISLLRSADICLVMWNKDAEKSVGTHSEMTDAFLSGKKVYLVTGGVKIDNLPAWVIGVTTKYFKSAHMALSAIHEEGNKLPTKKPDKINVNTGGQAVV